MCENFDIADRRFIVSGTNLVPSPFGNLLQLDAYLFFFLIESLDSLLNDHQKCDTCFICPHFKRLTPNIMFNFISFPW